MARTRTAATGLLVAAMACGGGDSGTNPVPPPPPPGPASVAFTAGAGQSASPGAALDAEPVVVVRDAQSRPLSGVAVTFAVEAGGGTIEHTSAATAADGTASPGTWTLGLTEGENRLAATAGTLHASITADARFPSVKVADTTIGPGGGTITFHKAGDPLDGLTVEIPDGAFSAPTHWVLASRPQGVVPAVSAGNIEGGVLEIHTDAVRADSLVVLRLPHVDNPDRFAMAFMRDPATGRIEGLPVVATDATTLSAGSLHFNAGLFAERPATALRGSIAAPEPGTVHVFVASVDFPRLEQPIASGFIPGVDDWEFTNLGTYLVAGGQCAGQSISAMWYYYRQRAVMGPLFGHFDAIPAIEPDDARGLRFVSEVQAGIDWDRMRQQVRQMKAQADRAGVNLDRLAFYSMAYTILVTHQPQLVGLFAPSAGHAVVAFGTERGRILVADPNFPGTSREISYLNGKLGPFSASLKATSESLVFDTIRFQSASAMFPLTDLDALWPQVENGTIGGDFPSYRVEAYDWMENDWQQVRGDSLTSYHAGVRLRIICPECWGAIGGGAPNQQTAVVVTPTGDAAGVDRGKDGYEATLAGGQNRFGAIVYGAPQELNGGWSWLDFRWLDVRALAFTLTPDPALGKANDQMDFLAHPNGGAPPGDTRYQWDFGDGSGVVVQADSAGRHTFTKDGVYFVTVTMVHKASGRKIAQVVNRVVIGNPFRIDPDPAEGNPGEPVPLVARNLAPGTPSLRYLWDFGDGKTAQMLGDSVASHTWAQAGNYTVTVVMQNPQDGSELGRATGQVNIVSAKGVWRLTLFVLNSSVFPRNPTESWSQQAYGDDYVIFQAMQTHPDYALIAYVAHDTTAGGTPYTTGAYLVYDATKQAVGVNPAYALRGLARSPTTPPVAVDVADAFTVSGTLGAGGMTGQAVNVKLLFAPFYTLTYWKIDAVKEGTLLRGTITRVQTLWEGQGFGQPLANYGDIVHEWTFRATRVQ